MGAIDYNNSYSYYMDLAAAWCRKDSDQQPEYDQCLALAPGIPMQDVAAILTLYAHQNFTRSSEILLEFGD
jgi:hypothetical protein